MPDDIDALMNRLIDELAERNKAADAEIAAMRAQGLEPSPVDDVLSSGCPVFWFSLRWATAGSDDAEIRLGAQRDRRDGGSLIWGEAWPRRGALISASALLSALSEAWTAIGRHYLAHPVPDPAPASDLIVAELQLDARCAGKASAKLPALRLHCHRTELALAGDAIITRFGSESLIVVEVLKSLGDLIAQRLASIGRTDEAIAWHQVRDLVAVMPFAVEFAGDLERATQDIDAEASFYARRIGIAEDVYRRTAVWLHARQMLHRQRSDTNEPTCAEWDPLMVQHDLPDDAAVTALASEAAKLCESALADFVENAIHDHNLSARAAVFYRSWPERLPYPAPANPDRAD